MTNLRALPGVDVGDGGEDDDGDEEEEKRPPPLVGRSWPVAASDNEGEGAVSALAAQASQLRL